MEIGTFEAKTRFSEILDEVREGREYTITNRGKPVAKLVPIQEKKTSRKEIVRKLSAYRAGNGESFDVREAIEAGRK